MRPSQYLIIALAAFAPGVFASAAFESEPRIQRNPNARAPLAAVLSFEASGATRTRIEMKQGDRRWHIDFDRVPSADESLPILGMRAARQHELTITIYDEYGAQATWPEPLIYTTPPLPTDRYRFPEFKVNVSEPARMEPGITLLSVRRALQKRPQDRTRQQNRFVMNFGLLIALDAEGEVVWYLESDDRVAGIDLLRNGNIIYHLASFETVEMDWLGNKINTWYAEKRPRGASSDPDAIAINGMQTLHHQPHEVRDGTFLSFSANWRLIENWYTNEYDPEPRMDQKVMGDTIIEFTKAGDIVWTWNAFDYFDVFQIGYEAFNPYWVTRGFPDTWDWSHGNGVSYDPRDDSIVASFKLLDGIVKVDRKSKAIKWIFADPIGWKGETRKHLLKPLGEDFRWPWHQHNPRWTHAGTLLVFNNNRAQARPFDGRPHSPFEDVHSYSVEYEIDEDAGTVRQVWISEPEMTPDSCNSSAMSETHRLRKTDNMLEINAVCIRAGTPNVTWDPWDRSKPFMAEIPQGGRVREYTRTSPAEVVFEVDFSDPHEALNWQVYGGLRTLLYEGAPH